MVIAPLTGNTVELVNVENFVVVVVRVNTVIHTIVVMVTGVVLTVGSLVIDVVDAVVVDVEVEVVG